MRYNYLTNDVFTRNRLTFPYLWWTDSFTTEELDQFETLCDDQKFEDGIAIGKNGAEKRKNKVKFFAPDEKTQWIFDRYNSVISTINDKFYGFDLYGYNKFQYSVYESDDKYDWHMDLVIGTDVTDMASDATRKLSIIMLLNEPDKDFTGGEFEISLSANEDATKIDMKRGMIIAIPSFVVHRVKPVLTGIRKSIVIWVEGPKFK